MPSSSITLPALSRRDACVLAATSLAGWAVGCATAQHTTGGRVESARLGSLPDGRPVNVHTLSNHHGLKVRIMDYGATVLAIETPDRGGVLANILCGAPTLEPYLQGFPAAAVIGRFANRINRARFTLDGHEVHVTANSGQHHIHGGREGFASKLWQSQTHAVGPTASATFNYRSADGEEGFPGNLAASVTYTLNAANELVLQYSATTDQPTVVNLTNHAYFNLAGTGDVLGHLLQIFADDYTPADADLIPTGAIAAVTGTPLDFRVPHRIGERIGQIVGPSGYDHNYVLRGAGGSLRQAARVVEPNSGRVLECSTTQPGVQLYTANHFNGRPYPKHGAFCLETQHFPDSPNQPKFPSTVLRPEQPFHSETRFRFSLRPA